MIPGYRGITSKSVALILFVTLFMSLSTSVRSAETDESATLEMQMPPAENTSPPSSPSEAFPSAPSVNQSTAPTETPPALPKDELILIQAKDKRMGPMVKMQSYIVQSGGSLPIYDEDFRDFLDYGASINLGIKQKVASHLYFTPMLGFILLNGDWVMNENRDSLHIEAQNYNTTYGETSPENVNPVNTGEGYVNGGEAVITNAEFLQHIDLETSMYIVPLSLNLTFQLHDEGVRKINPYIGGGFGVCVAKRDVESRTLKEKRYVGPNYYLDFNDNQTVTGRMFQFFAGIEIPILKNMKIVAESNTALCDLKKFDPILSVSFVEPIPSGYQGTDMLSFSHEDPIEVGVFKEEFFTSLSIGLIVPF
jgi:hypothetical protein